MRRRPFVRAVIGVVVALSGRVLPAPVCAATVSTPVLRVGPRGGLEIRNGTAPLLGLDARLSFLLSPLTLNPTFAYVSDARLRQYVLGFNALYDLPWPARTIDLYVGAGFQITSFAYKAEVSGVDDNGQRLGMNLLAGVCFAWRRVAPFVEGGKKLGELDPLWFGAGLSIAVDGDERWDACGRRLP